jgi:hypothetical protein
MSLGYLTGARRKTNWDLRYFPAGSIRSFLRKATFIFVIRVLQAIRELLILLFNSTCDRCPHECLTDTPFKRQMTTLTVFNSSWPLWRVSAGSESPRTVVSDGPERRRSTSPASSPPLLATPIYDSKQRVSIPQAASSYTRVHLGCSEEYTHAPAKRDQQDETTASTPQASRRSSMFTRAFLRRSSGLHIVSQKSTSKSTPR